MSRRTAYKKLTKLHWPSRKRSRKRLIVLLEPKKWRGTTNFRQLSPDQCPHFQIRSSATAEMTLLDRELGASYKCTFVLVRMYVPSLSLVVGSVSYTAKVHAWLREADQTVWHAAEVRRQSGVPAAASAPHLRRDGQLPRYLVHQPGSRRGE